MGQDGPQAGAVGGKDAHHEGEERDVAKVGDELEGGGGAGDHTGCGLLWGKGMRSTVARRAVMRSAVMRRAAVGGLTGDKTWGDDREYTAGEVASPLPFLPLPLAA